MIEEYIKYWGLQQHPFLLAPDSKMMCVTGQYYECFERLRYAINTNKGGVLVVSEDAGLGKTTILLKLIDDMKEQYGDAFKYAFIDHPTLSASQMIAQITGCITGTEPSDDTLKNLMVLKDTLIAAKERGGKHIIIVDEGQMLCGAHDVLQELRMLINLTHNSEYLHTFILSGQRALWNTIKGMPEFWQRLPVRYYLIPLRLEDTKEIVRYRLKKAGLAEEREIFAEDALEIIHRYSMGSPRTIIGLSDLSLLIGYTNRANRITFKEVSKAINAMAGKGDTLPYLTEEKKKDKEPSLSSFAVVDRGRDKGKKHVEYGVDSLKGVSVEQRITAYTKPAYVVLAIIFFILVGAMGYHFIFAGKKDSQPVMANKEIVKLQQEKKVQEQEPLKQEVKTPVAEPRAQKETVGEKVETLPKAEAAPPLPSKMAVVIKNAANIRTAPDINAPRIALLFKGESIKIMDERMDRKQLKWYKIVLYQDREGWIADSVIAVK